MKYGRLLVRAVIGGLFAGHGTQKLFGWFGGPGPDGAEQMMKGIEMHPPRPHAYAAGPRKP
jgi:putative oxidoreductase